MDIVDINFRDADLSWKYILTIGACMIPLFNLVLAMIIEREQLY